MNYLTKQDVLHIIDRLKERDPKARSQNLFGLVSNLRELEAALDAPKVKLYGKEQYPSLESKAAVLFYSLTKAHALADGNKRTAVASLIVFLDLNGKKLSLDKDELYQIALRVAKSRSGHKDVITELVDIFIG